MHADACVKQKPRKDSARKLLVNQNDEMAMLRGHATDGVRGRTRANAETRADTIVCLGVSLEAHPQRPLAEGVLELIATMQDNGGLSYCWGLSEPTTNLAALARRAAIVHWMHDQNTSSSRPRVFDQHILCSSCGCQDIVAVCAEQQCPASACRACVWTLAGVSANPLGVQDQFPSLGACIMAVAHAATIDCMLIV